MSEYGWMLSYLCKYLHRLSGVLNSIAKAFDSYLCFVPICLMVP